VIKPKVKYTPEQEAEMLMEYEACETDEEREQCVLDLAEKYGKNKRMIVAKLSKMEIYRKKPVVSKVTGGKPETKENMVRRLETKLGYPKDDFLGLEKAPKLVLQKLLGEK
jgi:hypothetical protein